MTDCIQLRSEWEPTDLDFKYSQPTRLSLNLPKLHISFLVYQKLLNPGVMM